jgi:transketolase C-terminal domain/subunit
MNEELIPIKLVGSGRDSDYLEAGFTHHSFEAKAILGTLENLEVFFPQSVTELRAGVSEFVFSKKPGFLSLRR